VLSRPLDQRTVLAAQDCGALVANPRIAALLGRERSSPPARFEPADRVREPLIGMPGRGLHPPSFIIWTSSSACMNGGARALCRPIGDRMSSIGYLRDADGIVTLTLDAPGESVNTMNDRFRADLALAVERLEGERDRIEGVILTRANRRSSPEATCARSWPWPWGCGPLLRRTAGDQALVAPTRDARQTGGCRDQRRRPGGGLEIALACHRRICIDNPSIRIGFPEVTLVCFRGPGRGQDGSPSRTRGGASLPDAGRSPDAARGTSCRIHRRNCRRPRHFDGIRTAVDRDPPKPSQPWDDPERGIPAAGHRVRTWRRASPATSPHSARVPSRITRRRGDSRCGDRRSAIRLRHRDAGRVTPLVRVGLRTGREEHDRHVVLPAQRDPGGRWPSGR